MVRSDYAKILPTSISHRFILRAERTLYGRIYLKLSPLELMLYIRAYGQTNLSPNGLDDRAKRI